MAKHSARRNIRGGVALGAVLAATTLTAGMAYASAGTSPGPVPATCADALTAYDKAQDHQSTAKRKLDAANKEFDAATKALADARAADATEDSKKGAPVDDPAKPDAQDAAKTAAEARAFTAGETQSAAQKTYDADVAATAAARAQVNKPITDGGCAGIPGANGSNGADGKDGQPGVSGTAGKDGIDAKIILAPGMCAEAVVTPDPAKLVRIVTLIPCPPAVPPAPPAPPAADQPVTVIPPAAPAPAIQEAHLPVTH